MSEKSTEQRLKTVLLKLETIKRNCQKHGGIVNTLNEADEWRPAILMHLAAIQEQLAKIAKNNDISHIIDKKSLAGFTNARNFIAHDYEGVNLAIIEQILRYNLPELEAKIRDFLNSKN